MGTTASSLHDLCRNEHLQRLVGKDCITRNDPFWNQLLSFTIKPPRTREDCEYLDESVKPLLQMLLTNNAASRNFGSLVSVFLTRALELKASAQCENSIFTWQTYNALFITKCIAKYFIVTVTEDNVAKQFQSPSEDDGKHDDLLESYINALVEIIVDLPVMDFTYPLHVEAIESLLVLLSVQMFSSHSAAKSCIYRFIMKGKCSIHALLLTKGLLQSYVRQDKCPESYHNSPGGSIIIGLASGLWNVLTLGYGKRAGDQENQVQDTILAHQSLLLLLVLVNHCTSDKGICNPYRKALFSFVNSQDSGNSVEAVPSFKLDYSKLYDTLCATLKNDETTLLLYLLLHRNAQFKTYVLSRSNVEVLMIPILKVLYDAPEKTSHHIYMSLIILLILSEDDLFSEAVHDISLKNVAWYTERSLSEISLGGLLILVVIRTIHFNMTRMRDKYLHTNCLAALANMSGHFRGLHPYVCQRFVSLFETLSKRLSRVMDQIRNNPDLNPSNDDDFSTDLLQDLSILEEVLRMILEIINSCLSTQLQTNPNLLYSLLYKRQAFEPFRMHPNFQDVVQNLDTVLSYFSSRLEAGDKSLSVSDVMEIIKEAALHLPTDRLKKFPELKFRYVEEAQPEDFFIPYIWTIVYKCAGIPWSQQNLILFNPNKDL